MQAVFVLLWLWSSSSAWSQAPSGGIQADRPGFTEPTNILPRGAQQWEFGTYFEQLYDGSIELSQPGTLWRWGLADGWELRAKMDGWTLNGERRGIRRIRSFGLSDWSLGAKRKVLGQGRWTPALTLLPEFSFPSQRQSGARPGGSLRLSWSRDLPGNWTVGGNEVVWLRETSALAAWSTPWRHASSWTVEHALRGELSTFFEVYRSRGPAYTPEDRRAAYWVADTGIVRKVGTNLQVDFGFGWTVAAARQRANVPRYFLTFGLVMLTQSGRSARIRGEKRN